MTHEYENWKCICRPAFLHYDNRLGVYQPCMVGMILACSKINHYAVLKWLTSWPYLRGGVEWTRLLSYVILFFYYIKSIWFMPYIWWNLVKVSISGKRLSGGLDVYGEVSYILIALSSLRGWAGLHHSGIEKTLVAHHGSQYRPKSNFLVQTKWATSLTHNLAFLKPRLCAPCPNLHSLWD